MNKILGLLLMITSCVYSQEVIYFDKTYEVTTKENAAYYKSYDSSGEGFVLKEFFISGVLKMSGYVLQKKPEIRHGEFLDYEKDGTLLTKTTFKNNKREGKLVEYYENGNVHMCWNFSNDVLNDTSKSYYEDGTFKRFEVFRNGTFINGKVVTRQGKDTTFYPYYRNAKFRRGIKSLYKYIRKNTKYSQAYKNEGIQGKVFLRFAVDEMGKVVEIEVLKSANPKLNQLAIDVFNQMPDWRPAMEDGKGVKIYYNIPISFKLP